MDTKLITHSRLPAAKILQKMSHVLVVLPAGQALPPACPDQELLAATLKRRGKPLSSLTKTPALAVGPAGGLRVWCMLDMQSSRFVQQTQLRKAMQLLLDEHPSSLDVLLVGDADFARLAAELATYVGLSNGAALPSWKNEDPPKPLGELVVWGGTPVVAAALAEAGLLARSLIVQPPNRLTPAHYRARLAQLAGDSGWKIEEFGVEKLRKLGAGAFLAVAQGCAVDDAAIVRLSYRPKGATRSVALVGKGICFDTGGHQLKSARYMAGMHEDMAGSAVALGILLAASRLRLPVRLDVWLALATNEISPQAYRPGDVVTALNGTTIEIVHTDAEGRMVLADTLALAARKRPEVVIDFATLTGSMVTALGTRYSGVFASSDELTALALAAGRASGERVCAFPMDADYDEALDSTVADVRQCILEGEADHILAARFLQRFVGELPWVHVDLAAASCKGGLGAIGSEQTGFGVAWGIEFLSGWLNIGRQPG